MPSLDEITQLLVAYGSGDRQAMDRLMPIMYERLKKLAHAHLRNERRDHTLGATGLVHEAYLKLVDIHQVQWQNRVHFMAMASTVMRRILINYARDRKALKRGGDIPRETLDEELLIPDTYAETLLELDNLLTQLEAMHPRTAEVVQHRYFAGLTNEEIAELMGVSLSTVEREVRFARAWLSKEWNPDLAF